MSDNNSTDKYRNNFELLMKNAVFFTFFHFPMFLYRKGCPYEQPFSIDSDKVSC